MGRRDGGGRTSSSLDGMNMTQWIGGGYRLCIVLCYGLDVSTSSLFDVPSTLVMT